MAQMHWRGSRFDARTVDMLKEAERLSGIRIEPTQGSYNTSVSASAGTHAGGGAVDIRTRHLTRPQVDQLVAALRRVGFAAWYRTRAQGFTMDHIHGIAVDCPDLSTGAQAQVSQYLRGTNGLKGAGRDDGPRQWAGRTWEQYRAEQKPEPDDQQQAAASTEEDDDMAWLMVRKQGGAAYLLCGSTAAYGLYDGGVLQQAQAAGIPFLDKLDEKTWNALMKGRKAHHG